VPVRKSLGDIFLRLSPKPVPVRKSLGDIFLRFFRSKFNFRDYCATLSLILLFLLLVGTNFLFSALLLILQYHCSRRLIRPYIAPDVRQNTPAGMIFPYLAPGVRQKTRAGIAAPTTPAVAFMPKLSARRPYGSSLALSFSILMVFSLASVFLSSIFYLDIIYNRCV
jgi:hypothetical protein